MATPADQKTEATYAFVDLAGFTALTEAHGDVDAADLAERFAAMAKDALGQGDRLVKSIGDAVLVVSPDPQSALAFLRRLFLAAESVPAFPALRAGLNHGSAIQRGGDVYGAAVNLAARVAGQARGGQVLCTASVASVVKTAGVEVVEIGAMQFKNIHDPVPVYALAAAERAQHSAVDPVCKMRVERESAAGRLRFEAIDYYFCGLACAAKFAAEPAKFTK